MFVQFILNSAIDSVLIWLYIKEPSALNQLLFNKEP